MGGVRPLGAVTLVDPLAGLSPELLQAAGYPNAEAFLQRVASFICGFVGLGFMGIVDPWVYLLDVVVRLLHKGCTVVLS